MELLVVITDVQHAANHPRHEAAKLHKRGDVLSFAPDGQRWGSQELARPDWRIIRVPGLSPAVAAALVAEELPEALGGNRWLRLRQFTLDVDLLGVPAERAPHSPDCIVTPGQLHQAMSLKPKLFDPAFVGPRF